MSPECAREGRKNAFRWLTSGSRLQVPSCFDRDGSRGRGSCCYECAMAVHSEVGASKFGRGRQCGPFGGQQRARGPIRTPAMQIEESGLGAQQCTSLYHSPGRGDTE